MKRWVSLVCLLWVVLIPRMRKAAQRYVKRLCFDPVLWTLVDFAVLQWFC